VPILSAAIRRGIIRCISKDAIAAGTTLVDAIDAALAVNWASVKTGTLITGTSSNGQSVSLQSLSTAAGQMSPSEMFAVLSWLRDLYDTAVATLAADPTDAQILTAILARQEMQSIKRRYHDHSPMRD
jgi:hypothetical protein